jgi:hypothetical protein
MMPLLHDNVRGWHVWPNFGLFATPLSFKQQVDIFYYFATTVPGILCT